MKKVRGKLSFNRAVYSIKETSNWFEQQVMDDGCGYRM